MRIPIAISSQPPRWILPFQWLLCLTVFSPWNLASADQEKGIDFAHQVVPIFRVHCIKCHAGDNTQGGLSFNTHEEILAGGDSGPIYEAGKADASRIIEVVESEDDGERMPPEGARISQAEIEILRRWIDEGAKWEDGFAFNRSAYEPALKPRKPDLPSSLGNRTNPIDRIIDRYLAERDLAVPQPISDNTFLRRVTLDLTGLLPESSRLQTFLADDKRDKRSKAIDELLQDDVAYAEHWLSFWNDLLRNDYDGTGFITGGRKQISGWLYNSLIQNKPYDLFVRELISPPNDESRGFIDGIKWRGEVSAGQTVEIQFAQSLSQSLLGINMKCASCHDSFVDRWKLEEAYGLAAIYSNETLEIHRCDKPIGKTATPMWLFPELGQVDPSAVPAERLRQLAGLMTHPENGRLTRTIVNRLWHRMMGRGIVHPTDAMQSEPWNSDLLDFLASDFADHGYDIKHTLRLIANSQAYQAQCEVQAKEESAKYQYTGPRSRRLTAEQFVDSLWQITNTAPTKMDASFPRGKAEWRNANATPVIAKWIWSTDNTIPSAAGEKIAVRRRFELQEAAQNASVVVSCDNAFTLYIDQKKVGGGSNWGKPELLMLGSLAAGAHEILIVAENQGDAPNPAGVIAQIQFEHAEKSTTLATDTNWQWTSQLPDENGVYGQEPSNWQPVALVAIAEVWASANGEIQAALSRASNASKRMLRASLMKSDNLMRTLGRPNRDQIVSMRPNDLSTLEAIDLENGEQVATLLSEGSNNLLKRTWSGPNEFVTWLYLQALSREPTAEETAVALDALGNELTPRSVEDLVWAVLMLPEFQIVR